jgi:MYXO-CTERM domain-containing protein
LHTVLHSEDGTFAHIKNIKMKKFAKTFVAVMLCCSLTIAAPLLAQNDATTRTVQTADRNDDDDDIGMWGLAGLIGLLGLLGLRRRDDDNRARVSRNP